MEIAATIKAVCEIAKDSEERDDVSVITLLKASGYLKNPEQITEQRIVEFLQEHPDLVSAWVQYSEDKRTDGWYISGPQADPVHPVVWSVGFYPGGETREFRDGTTACAFYVKQELEQMRGHIEKAR